MSARSLKAVAARNRAGERAGLAAFCTASERALDAVLDFAGARGLPVLVEATCNQVNPQGGYTGLGAAEFRDRLHALADAAGCPRAAVLFGGDHLGPNPWRREAAEAAMAKGEALVASYAQAGAAKIHLDASMACGGEPPLSPQAVAERAARLCAVAEAAADAATPPVYVIGTEVPAPGGETDDMSAISVTDPERVAETVETHRAAFAARGLEAAWERVLAVVVQPGVDFSHEAVLPFDPAGAAPLAGAVARLPGGLVYEAHSTDYQTGEALAGLVDHRFAVLKVGPEVTFALREAILALSLIEEQLVPAHRRSGAVEAVLAAMDADPRHWRDYYRGTAETVAMLKLFSYSDRIRYYWGVPAVSRAVTGLLDNLTSTGVPGPLVSQFFPHLAGEPLDGRGGPAATLMRRHVQVVAQRYYRACGFAVGTP